MNLTMNPKPPFSTRHQPRQHRLHTRHHPRSLINLKMDSSSSPQPCRYLLHPLLNLKTNSFSPLHPCGHLYPPMDLTTPTPPSSTTHSTPSSTPHSSTTNPPFRHPRRQAPSCQSLAP